MRFTTKEHGEQKQSLARRVGEYFGGDNSEATCCRASCGGVGVIQQGQKDRNGLGSEAGEGPNCVAPDERVCGFETVCKRWDCEFRFRFYATEGFDSGTNQLFVSRSSTLGEERNRLGNVGSEGEVTADAEPVCSIVAARKVGLSKRSQ